MSAVSEATGSPTTMEGRAIGLFRRSFCAEWFTPDEPEAETFVPCTESLIRPNRRQKSGFATRSVGSVEKGGEAG